MEHSIHPDLKLNVPHVNVRRNDVVRLWWRLELTLRLCGRLWWQLKSIPVLKMELGAPRIRLDLRRRRHFEHHVGDHVGGVVVSLVAVQLVVHVDLEVSTES